MAAGGAAHESYGGTFRDVEYTGYRRGRLPDARHDSLSAGGGLMVCQ